MITDVRGSGKTVLLTELAAHFRERKDCTERELLNTDCIWTNSSMKNYGLYAVNISIALQLWHFHLHPLLYPPKSKCFGPGWLLPMIQFR